MKDTNRRPSPGDCDDSSVPWNGAASAQPRPARRLQRRCLRYLGHAARPGDRPAGRLRPPGARSGGALAVVPRLRDFYGINLWLAAALFNIIWAHLRRSRLLEARLEPDAVKAIGRRFALALPWIGSGIILGAVAPIAGVVIIAAFLPAYYFPIRGEYGRPSGPQQTDVTALGGRRGDD